MNKFQNPSAINARKRFTSLDYPGGTLTTARGINDHGEIVGAYRTVPPRHALLINYGQYIPLAPETVLGANFSEAYKINDRGDVVGGFQDVNGFSHGFLLHKGVLTTLDFPGASDTYGLRSPRLHVDGRFFYPVRLSRRYRHCAVWHQCT